MWTTPPKAAASGRWPAGRDEIRARCEAYVAAIRAGRTPGPDTIRCVRVGAHYRIREDDLDAWVTRKLTVGV